MRHLFILRHAQAAQSQSGEDKHRPLTKQGLADALALGQTMKAKGYIPDFVIGSPARRAQQTAKKVLEATGPCQTVSPATAYYTTIAQLYELIKMVDAKYQGVLLVSHNPSVHGLAKFLAGLGPDDAMYRLRSDYKECTLTVLECPIDSWSTLMPSQNDLSDLLIQGRDFTGHIS